MLQHNTGLTLILALSYSSRRELTDAVRRIAIRVKTGELKEEDINEKVVSSHLYTAAVPDPDLLVRTSGELRVSNFLLWQLAYTEIYVTDVLWPDFRRTALMKPCWPSRNANADLAESANKSLRPVPSRSNPSCGDFLLRAAMTLNVFDLSKRNHIPRTAVQGLTRLWFLLDPE